MNNVEFNKGEVPIKLSDLGNIYSSSGDFTTRAAILQSYYRSSKSEPCGLTRTIIVAGKDANGKTVKKSVPKEYGHILSEGETKNKNFFFQKTFDYAQKRVKFKIPEETIDSNRLFNNLLSSMPLAFNLFHPLMMIMDEYPETSIKMVQNLFPELPIGKLDSIRIEFIPTPISRYTNNRSAMDAAIEFRDTNGEKYVIAVETKYTDELGQNKASDNSTLLHIAKELEIFTDAGIKQIENGCTQLYRNFLLTEQYRAVERMKDSYSIILAPRSHPTTEKEVKSLLPFLKPEYHYKLKKYTLEDFVKQLEINCPDNYKEWLSAFYDRYLNFEKVEYLYQQFNRP